MNNNSSQNRFAKITAKVFVMLLAVVLSLSVLPELSADILPVASADEISYTVPAISSRDELANVNANLASQPAGTVINATLVGDINFTDASTDTFSSGITGLVIPADVTVNLFLNGHSIVFDRSSSGAWQLPFVYGIHNKGTLNIYSGASVTGSSNSASITIRNARTGMSATDERERAYCALEGVHNEGALTINKGVNISISSQLQYDKINTGGSLTTKDSAQVTAGAAAVSNVGTGSSCSVNAVTFTVSAFSEGTFSSNSNGGSYTDSVAFAYGIYGGNVSVAGDTKINVTSNANHSRDTYMGSASDGKAWITSVALGLVTSGSVSVTGGSITHDANITNTDAVKSDGSGRQYLYSAGIYTTTGSVPVIPECTITTPNENCMNTTEGTVTYRKGTVLTGGAAFRSVSDIVSYMTSFRDHYVQVPTDNVTAGTYKDEANDTYTTEASTSANAVPKAMQKGAISGTNRVHIVYRYWETSGRKNIVKTIVGKDGNVGYSFDPLADGTNVVNSEVVLEGVTEHYKAPGAKISYKSGAESCNEYYWDLIGVYYATTSTPFSDYKFTSSSVTGTAIKTFDDTGAINKPYTSTDGAVYIFVDYAMLSPTSIKAKVGTANTVSTVYTGSPVKASDLGLKILDSVYETDYTSEYNIDFTDASLINVNFTYSGTNTAGVEETDTGRLPTNAGTYAVKLTIEESTEYTKEPKTNKNRRALEYTFTLIIEQASIGRGDLPESVTLTYGETLADTLKLTTRTAAGLKNEAGITGMFTFTNPADGTGYKSVGKDKVVTVKWTPTYSESATEKNYKETVFNVLYTVEKAVLTIEATNATVVYGNSDVNFGYDIVGLVAAEKENVQAVKDAIDAVIQYTVLPTGATQYTSYTPGAFAAGYYNICINISPASAPAVLDNYAYVLLWGDGYGKLEVTKRPINVIAAGKDDDRVYAPEDYSFVIEFSVPGPNEEYGIFAGDDVEFADFTGTLRSNNAGRYEVTITKDDVVNRITGGTAGNYYVNEVIYDTGSKLYYTIGKAVPAVTTPVVADRYYQQAVTLKDVSIASTGSSVAGEWTWEDETITPNVNTTVYKAIFTPKDSTNYDIKVVDVTIRVKPTPVEISYSASVSYGDNIPNITAYTYKSDLDPQFSIDKVKTTGNITPSTNYVKGAPVQAGGYAVTISAPNFVDVDGNYTFTTKDGVITVTPRVITFRPDDITLTYGDNFMASASTVNVSFDEKLLVGNDTIESITANGTAPTFTYGSSFSNTSAYGVGTYTLTITPSFATSANYTVDTQAGKLTVVKADLTIKAKDITLTYGSAVPQDIYTAFEVIGAKRGETLDRIVTGGSINVATTYYEGASVNEKGYPVTINTQGASFANYNVSVENGTITVIKATPVISSLPTASIVYTETLGDAVFTGGVVANGITGSFVYDSAATVPAYKTDAYTSYSATFIPDDIVNYNTVRALYVPLTVARKPVSGSLAVSGIPMVGTTAPLTVDVSGLDPAEAGVYTISWYLNGSASASATGNSYAIPETAANQTLKVVAVANAPYTGTVEYTLTIAPELADINVLLNDINTYFTISGLENSIYDATQHNVVIEQSAATSSGIQLGTITVKYNGSTVAPTNAGTYTVSIDVATPSDEILGGMTSDGKYNNKLVYAPVSNYRIGEITIAPAKYNVAITIADKVYDGTTKATIKSTVETGAIELAGGQKDDVAFDKASAECYFAAADAGIVAVGVNKASLKGSAAKNYVISYTVANENGKAEITKKDLAVTIVPVERNYEKGNTNVNLSFVIDEKALAAGDNGFVYVDESKAAASVATADAGFDKAVTASGIVLTGSKAANYNLVIANEDALTVTIHKAVPAYPVPQPITLSYDSARKLSDVVLCDGDTRWDWLAQDKSNPLPAGTYRYTAIFTPTGEDSENYATVEREVEIRITKAKVTVTADSSTVVYGEIEPTYSYRVTGLTGTDSVQNAVDGYVLLNCAYEAGSVVGNYPIVITGAFESDNYDFVYVNGSVTVNKRPAYVEAVPVSREYAAGNFEVEVKFVNLTNIYSGDGAGVVKLATDSVIGTITEPDAGSDKPVSFEYPDLVGAKADNYELRLLDPNVYVEILKANLKGIKLPTAGQLYYGQKLSSIEFKTEAASGGLGTFSMENGTTVVKEIGTFANKYKVVFTPVDQKNYNTISQYIEVTVLPAYINIALSIMGTTQVGKVIYVVTNDIPTDAFDYLVFDWYRVDSPDADPRTGYKVASDTDTYTLTEADEGKYIICTATVTANAPYECNARCVTATAIEEQTLTLWQKFINWFYRIISNLTQLFGGAFG